MRIMPLRIGLIGHGAIGQEIGEALGRLGETSSLVSVLVRPGRDAGGFKAAHGVGEMVAEHPTIVLECAGHAAVTEYGAALLGAGVDLVLTSIGALADDAVMASLGSAASRGGGRLLIAPGAVAGLDGLIAARLGGLNAVTYTSYKPPAAWRGTAAEAALDPNGPEEQIIFEGSAREAALAYPKNANVAVTVGLCGLGLDRTRARLVSSRKVSDPLGVIEAEGAFGRFSFEIFARAAPDNPKTSLLTAHSLLQCARLGVGLPVLELVERAEPMHS